MSVLTKTAADVYAPFNSDGTPRSPSLGDAVTYHTEIERGLADIPGMVSNEVEGVSLKVDQETAALQLQIDTKTGDLKTQIDDLSVSGDTVTKATWAQLSAVVGARDGQRGFVESDGSTHIDPVVGGSVSNAGVYTWSTSPAGWRWLRNDQVLKMEASVQRGQVVSGTSMKSLTAPGTYLCAGTGYTDIPSDLTGSFFLKVSTTGGASGTGGAGHVTQEIVSYNALGVTRKIWVTSFQASNPPASLSWQNLWSVYNLQLTDNYAYVGALNGVDLRTITREGKYIISGPCTHAPQGAMIGAKFEVKNYGNFITQSYESLTDASIGWSLAAQPGSNVWNPWVPYASSAVAGSQFTGKTIVCLGDSITEGGDYTARLGSRLGATVVKGGFGGCRMSAHNNPLYDTMSMYRLAGYIKSGDWQPLIDGAQTLFETLNDDNRAQSTALASLDWSKVDYIVIFFGTNDFTANVPIGVDGDIGGASFKGAINSSISDILSTYPSVRLMFITPMWRTVAEVPNTQGHVLTDYGQAILDRTQSMQIEAFDMYKGCGINPLTQMTLLPDGTHPAPVVGYQLVADKIGAALEARF